MTHRQLLKMIETLDILYRDGRDLENDLVDFYGNTRESQEICDMCFDKAIKARDYIMEAKYLLLDIANIGLL